jgi:hypothetical protein
MNIFESRKLRILAHFSFWLFIWSFMLLTTNTPSYTFVHNVFDISIDTILLMVPFYFNMYFLIPKYFRTTIAAGIPAITPFSLLKN